MATLMGVRARRFVAPSILPAGTQNRTPILRKGGLESEEGERAAGIAPAGTSPAVRETTFPFAWTDIVFGVLTHAELRQRRVEEALHLPLREGTMSPKPLAEGYGMRRTRQVSS